jgi:hypothetical protein
MLDVPAFNRRISPGHSPRSGFPIGNYMAGSFVTTADGHGGTLVTQAQAQQEPLLAHPQA